MCLSKAAAGSHGGAASTGSFGDLPRASTPTGRKRAEPDVPGTVQASRKSASVEKHFFSLIKENSPLYGDEDYVTFTVNTRDSFGNFKGFNSATQKPFESLVVKEMKARGLCLHLPSFAWAVIYVSAGRFKIRVTGLTMLEWVLDFVRRFAVVRAPGCLMQRSA